MTISKLVRLSKKGQIVLHKEMREGLGVKEGDEVVAILEENGIILTTPDLYAKMSRGLLKGTWGKSKREVEAYIKKEREAWQ